MWHPLPLPSTLLAVALALPAGPAAAAGLGFDDLAADPAAGLSTYRRTPSATEAIFDALRRQPRYTFADIIVTPEKSRGAPGVAILDYDGDGDLDLYVTNGPGSANSLFASQLADTGELRFVDVAVAAGVAAVEQDGTGVCYGDIDNDGDPDLLVLGRSEPNRLFENLGDGTFRDATAGSGLGNDSLGHTGCSFGDVDGDGLLDVAIANSFDWASRESIFIEPYAASHPNQLFLNLGEHRFADVSDSSGILQLTGFRPPADGAATITWALALVDYDLDGDVDLLHADDQAAMPRLRDGGIDRGYIHVLANDGTGSFTDVTPQVGTDLPGQWMGLAFADFDCDGHLDLFGTNMGDYAFTMLPIPYQLGDSSSRWLLGTEGGGFTDPGLGEIVADPFGWSPVAPDLDNDGDADIVYFGSLHAAGPLTTADNPGSVLINDRCSARFTADLDALAVDHRRRNVQGAATGDLDADGFPDLVSVSSADYPPPIPLTPFPVTYGSPYDAPSATFILQFAPVAENEFEWLGYTFEHGTLAVEINRGNGNRWLSVETLGTVGLTTGGAVNRSGIGAVVAVTPHWGRRSLRPVVGGASYASQDSLAATFGLGRMRSATVEVLWPGGVVNRLYNVAAGERLRFPEIPCSFAADWSSTAAYRACVETALDELVAAGVLAAGERQRFLASALRAFQAER